MGWWWISICIETKNGQWYKAGYIDGANREEAEERGVELYAPELISSDTEITVLWIEEEIVPGFCMENM